MRLDHSFPVGETRVKVRWHDPEGGAVIVGTTVRVLTDSDVEEYSSLPKKSQESFETEAGQEPSLVVPELFFDSGTP